MRVAQGFPMFLPALIRELTEEGWTVQFNPGKAGKMTITVFNQDYSIVGECKPTRTDVEDTFSQLVSQIRRIK